MRGRGEGSVRKRQRADGSVYWEARASLHGRQKSFYDDTKSGAMAAARQARVDAERGATKRSEDVSVGDHLLEWLEGTAKPSVRARTYMGYRSHVTVHLVPRLGHILLFELTPGQVQRMLATAMANGISETTARRIRATLSIALKAAMLDYGLPRNVASLAKVPKSDRPKFTPEVVSPGEA